MRIVNIQAAKTHLSRIVEEAAAGEDIVLAKAGRPMVRLIPYKPSIKKRRLGLFKGKIVEHPGCWDPDPEMEAEFTNGTVFPSSTNKKHK